MSEFKPLRPRRPADRSHGHARSAAKSRRRHDAPEQWRLACRLRVVPEHALLTAAAVLAAAIVGTVSTIAPVPHDSGAGGAVVRGDNRGGYVETQVSSETTTGSPAGPGSPSAASNDGCAWLLLFEVGDLDRPPLPSDGNGSWWQLACGGVISGAPVWVPAASDADQVLQASPSTLAQRAASRLPLPTPVVGLNPTPRALVNLPEWFWVPRSTWATLRQRTQAGPVWATVVARPTSTTWDPGDGSAPFTCAGPGTPYVKSEPVEAQRSDCTYTYTRSSANQPQSGAGANDRFFTVTVTTTWSVTWTGAGGTGGALPQMTRSSSFRLAVAERDAVVTGGSG